MQMSYLKNLEWEITPVNSPIVKRNCAKCGKKTLFYSTEKFRVNANKNLIDIWLIFKCEKCKSTWNMTLYERINPQNICKEEYEKFLANDKELANAYGYDFCIYNRNKAELIMDSMEYRVNAKELEYNQKENQIELKILCKYPLKIRVDKLLSQQLSYSRSQIEDLYQKGFIYSTNEANLLKSKVKDEMKIYIKKLGG